MNIVFMGNPPFAIPSLKKLVEERYNISAVITNPDRPAGRGRKIKAPEIKTFAKGIGLDVYQPKSLGDAEFVDFLSSLNPDLFVVVAFRILPGKLLEIPSVGSVNLHASLLPKYRGPAPINWAIINGETETGVTTFLIKPKVDTGDILIRRKCPIPPDYNYGMLYSKLADIGAEAIVETIKRIEKRSLKPIPQDNSKASKAPKITDEVRKLDFSKTTLEIINLIRGLSPKPGAFTSFRSKIIKILDAEKSEIVEMSSVAGAIKIDKKAGRLYVGCGDGYIRIKSIQPQGRGKLSDLEFINGYHPREGEILGEEVL